MCRCVAGDRFVREATPFAAARLGFRGGTATKCAHGTEESRRRYRDLDEEEHEEEMEVDGGDNGWVTSPTDKGTIQVIQVREQVFATRTVDRKEVEELSQYRPLLPLFFPVLFNRMRAEGGYARASNRPDKRP
ncbi:hypothetical protein HZH66_005492 [Vespula vulgaris]|uniref:Uncharacterized protein n=1 Tax=Vespula vulgaris TaxID=7454 RepID=A0A834NAH8_VESVU|nr:hypothetical protein HZH66_005492 [Vespula vulgaris]